MFTSVMLLSKHTVNGKVDKIIKNDKVDVRYFSIMSTGENHKPETLYEGWTDDEILFHQCIRFLHSLQEIFSTAHEAMKNQAWFINGTVEEIVADLKQKRAAIQKYLDGVRDPHIATVVETCAKKIDEYIGVLEKKLEHPLVQQQKREVRKRIKKTFS